MVKSNYIGSGSYGCAIKPGFSCSPSNDIIDNTISKLFSSERDYRDEVDIYKKVAAIDKDNKFTLKLISNCEIKPAYVNNNVGNINECKIIKNKEKVYQIIYEYGGLDLFKLFLNNQVTTTHPNLNIYQFLKKFIEIFKGLEILKRNGLVHRDIKIDNILFDGTKIILIDFGLLTTTDMTYKGSNPELYYDNQPFHYPIEVMLFSALLLNREIPNIEQNFLTMIDNYIQSNKNKFNQNQVYLNEIMKLNTYLSLKSKAYQDYFKTTYNKGTITLFDINEITKNISEKIDLYQLGIVIYDLIIIMIVIYKPQEINKIPIGVFQLLRGILEPNPFERYDINKVIDKYSKLFP